MIDESQAKGEVATRRNNQHVRGADKLAELGVDRQRLAEARTLARAVDDRITRRCHLREQASGIFKISRGWQFDA